MRADPSLQRPTGSEPVIAGDAQRYRLIWAMAEYFKLLGFTNVRARVQGFDPPPVLQGTIESHRPDLVCEALGHLVILEGISARALRDPHLDHRWSLFWSSCQKAGAELHFALPRWTEQGPLEPRVRAELHAKQIPAWVWAV